MRHLASVVVALLLTPAVWVLAGTGVVWAAGSGMFDAAIGLGALIVAGLAYALLALPRLSPVGPGLAGLVLLAAGVVRAAAPPSFVDAVPHDLLGAEDALHRPAEFAPLLAVPLLLTLAIPRRWRGTDRPGAAPGPGYPRFPAAEQPGSPLYSPPPPRWPQDPDETYRR